MLIPWIDEHLDCSDPSKRSWGEFDHKIEALKMSSNMSDYFKELKVDYGDLTLI